MNEFDIQQILESQRSYFSSGATLPEQARQDALCRLEKAIQNHEEAVYAALKTDLGKSSFESFLCELGLVLDEIKWMRKNLHALMKRKSVRTPITQMIAKSFQSPSPYGTVLIMSPWNYPVLLTLDPLVDAIAAGNTVLLKPSAYAPATAEVLRAILKEAFPKEHVAVVLGGRAENNALLQQKFDKIFFTGSPLVGKEVMRAAAENLTPVTLELGGKSPCIVDESCNLPMSAKRIVFGKYMNCGQTCVAPDYILCHESIHAELVGLLKKEIAAQFGEHPLENENYGKIINQKHFERLLGLLPREKVVYGGETDAGSLRIAPIILDHVSWDDSIMQEEIFGPILPVLTYRELEDALTVIDSRPHPLALYCFTERDAVKQRVLERCRFGGGCFNDTLVHLATPELPFGGVGESGMGSYHGETGFLEFSHVRSIVDRKTWFELSTRFQPYTKGKLDFLKRVLG